MSQYKLYLHIEESRALPEFTFIYKSSRDSPNSVRSLITDFVSAYGRKHGKDISKDTLQLVSESGKCVDYDTSVVKAFGSGDDVQVRVAAAACESHPTSKQEASPPDAVRGLQQLVADLQVDTNSAPTATATADQEHFERSDSQTSTACGKGMHGQQDGKVYLPIIKQFLERAKEAESKKYFRAACKIYKQVLKVAPSHKEALTALAHLWLTVSRPRDAVDVARQAANSAPDDPSTHRLLAECLRQSKQYPEALAAYNRALDLAKHCGGSIATLDDMQVDIVRVLYAMGGAHKDAAATLIMNVLRSNDHHQNALIVYAQMASEGGMVRDAVQVLIRVLIRAPNDQEIRLTLAKCLQSPEGMAALRAELDGGGETDAAMAFLATAIKDHGAVPASNSLFRRALELKPSSPSYALNLMHGLELEQDYTQALQLALNFCTTTDIETGGGLQVCSIVQQLQGLPQLTSTDPLCWLGLEPWTPQWTPHCSWAQPSCSPTSQSSSSSAKPLAEAEQGSARSGDKSAAISVYAVPAGHAGQERQQGGAQELGPSATPALGGGRGDCTMMQAIGDDDLVHSTEQQSGGIEKVEYTSTQLDFLALLFTVVKLLYIGGALARCGRVVQLLGAASRASAQELHKTLIRNEAAYFGCVKQLVLQHPPPPQPQPAATPPLYLCGDSHCLSGAWNVVHLRGEARVLVPRLVTGLKIWHMRQAGIFYPKHSFLTTMANLPDGAQVIFMFGEIDCREGLTMAVDKLKYETVDAAMDVLLSIYKDVLLKLVQQRGFEMFVHPIAPVLNETRHVVAPFNHKLKQQIEMLSMTPEAQGRLHWLDFYHDLVTPDGNSLTPTLHFDGTHMSPLYVKFLNAQLSTVV